MGAGHRRPGIHHPALEGFGGVVPLVVGEVLIFSAEPVAEVRVAPVKETHRGLGVGVEEELVRFNRWPFEGS
jgi:hypothetical protein